MKFKFGQTLYYAHAYGVKKVKFCGKIGTFLEGWVYVHYPKEDRLIEAHESWLRKTKKLAEKSYQERLRHG